MTKKYKVIFQPSGRRGEVEEGKTILEAAQALGVDIEGLCGNKKVCGKCKVRIEEGYFEKDNIESGMAHLSPLTDTEKKHIKPEDGPGIRLSCNAAIHGDIKVFVPERSRAGKQIVRKAAKELTIALDPAVKKYNIVLTPPTLHDMTVGDYERVLQSLKDNYGLDGLTFDFLALRNLQTRAARGRVERHGHRLDGPRDHQGRAGLRRAELRPGRRHRHHDLRRLPDRPGHRQGREHRVDHEPPGALRRGRDEPHHLRDEQPRGARDDAEGDHRGAQRHLPARRGRDRQKGPERRARDRRPDHRLQHGDAPHLPRHGPDLHRPLAVHPGGPELARHQGPRPGPPDRPGRLHPRAADRGRLRRRRQRRRAHRRGALQPGREGPDHRHRDQRRAAARQPREGLLDLLRDRPGLRGRADQVRHARRPRRHRDGQHRPGRPASRATRSSARPTGTPTSRRSRPRGSAAPGSSRSWPRCSRPGSSTSPAAS